MGQVGDHLGHLFQMLAPGFAKNNGEHDGEGGNNDELCEADEQGVLHDLPESGGGEQRLEMFQTHELVRTYDAVVIESQHHAQDGLELKDNEINQSRGQH